MGEGLPVSVSVNDLKAKLDSGDKPFLLDVRQPEEFMIARLEGAKLIPLGELEERIGELDKSQNIVVYCHHGVRSMHAVYFLKAAGFEKVQNLTGGIDAWSHFVDPSVPVY